MAWRREREYDQRREAQLRRAGWKFWRINGSSFYRNKEKTLEDLWQFLEEEGIYPRNVSPSKAENQQDSLPSRDDKDKKTIPSTPRLILTPPKYKNENKKKEPPPKAPCKEIQKGLLKGTESMGAPNDWKIWLELSQWIEETAKVNIPWASFAYETGRKLKLGRQFSSTQKL